MKTKGWIIVIILCMAVSSSLLLSSHAAAKPYDTWSLENIEALSLREESEDFTCLGSGSLECPKSYAKVIIYL